MTPELEEALARWESGELSREELVRRFPDQDIAGLLDTAERMRAAADVAAPDASAAWEAVRDHLPARIDDRRRGGAKAIRLLAAAMIAVLLMGATAYALVPSVRRAVDDAVHVIIGDEREPLRQADPGSDVDDPPATTPGEKSSTTSDASEAPGDDQSGQDPDGDSEAESDDDGTSGERSGSESDDGGEQGSSGDEGTTDGDAGTGSEEAAGEDQGSSGDEATSSENSGTGSEE